ncbi:hypothetical protein BFR81_01195 [Acinetobacter pittii]|nr:hypothetical protein BFR81_01195 [Acinetobacter pittii]
MSKNKSNSESEETISYTTTRCFGTCPVYTASIQPNGVVHFNGIMFTKTEGEKVTKVSRDTYNKISNELKNFRPNTGAIVDNQDCDDKISDQQSVNIVWKNKKGVETKLNHYYGCMDDSNKRLTQIIKKLPIELGIKNLFIK